MNCFEIGPSLPTYKEAEPSTETVYVDVEGLTVYSQRAQMLSLEQPENAPPSANVSLPQSASRLSTVLPLSLTQLLATILFSFPLIISLN